MHGSVNIYIKHNLPHKQIVFFVLFGDPEKSCFIIEKVLSSIVISKWLLLLQTNNHSLKEKIPPLIISSINDTNISNGLWKTGHRKKSKLFFTEFSFVMDLFIYFSVLLLVLYWWKIPYKLWVCREATKVFFSPFPMDRLVLLEEPIYIRKYGCWKQKQKKYKRE